MASHLKNISWTVGGKYYLSQIISHLGAFWTFYTFGSFFPGCPSPNFELQMQSYYDEPIFILEDFLCNFVICCPRPFFSRKLSIRTFFCIYSFWIKCSIGSIFGKLLFWIIVVQSWQIVVLDFFAKKLL